MLEQGLYKERKRIIEAASIVVISVVLVLVSQLETRLFSLSEQLSENREFFFSLAYFALININVILILILSFLIFRNVAKLVVERRRGVLGSRLRTKLVVALLFFALAPTVLLFYVSMRFITTSFETWFSEKVQTTIQQTREAGSLVYEQHQNRLQSLARIALSRVHYTGPAEIYDKSYSGVAPGTLAGFEGEYGLSLVALYDFSGRLVWSSQSLDLRADDGFSSEALQIFLRDRDLPSYSVVMSQDDEDVVRGVAPVRDPGTGRLLGMVLTEVRFETQIVKSVEKILSDFADLKPGAALIRMSYMILMVVMTLLIIFFATWLGFYVARGITGPLQSLSEAAREVSLGNYKISLEERTDDETGQLVRAFNLMTRDLNTHQQQTEEVQNHLRVSNEELEQRRRYMEILLKNITAGVLSVDPVGRISSFNDAAERLLSVEGRHLNGLGLKAGLGRDLFATFWEPIQEKLENSISFRGEIDLTKAGLEVILLVNASRIEDENGEDLGVIVVFDDAREQVRAQRVAAWREVARRIAHEIKNPITPIKLNAERLLRRYNDKFSGEDQQVFRSCIETILAQVDSLRNLVNEFGKFSRLPSIQPSKGQINNVLRNVMDLFRMSYPQISFEFSEDKDIPEFAFDAEQLNRVFVNLITNSLAALDDVAPGEISVSTCFVQDARVARIEIADNGCGIDPELRERVLEPYFSTKDEGTGLGLAIVNQIVTDHGGYLRLLANEPRGTRVILELSV